MTEKYFEAIRFATEKHKNQIRKIAPFPYMVHIYEVVQILRENGADEETLIGAILHDTVEDTGTSLDEIRERFGDNIATLVDYVTENKKMPYVERKHEHAQRLARGPVKAKMIKCADSLSNLRAIYLDEKYMGEEMWNAFNSSKENIQTHYYYSIKAFEEVKDTKMYKELVKYFKLTFVNRKNDKDKESDRETDNNLED